MAASIPPRAQAHTASSPAQGAQACAHLQSQETRWAAAKVPAAPAARRPAPRRLHCRAARPPPPGPGHPGWPGCGGLCLWWPCCRLHRRQTLAWRVKAEPEVLTERPSCWPPCRVRSAGRQARRGTRAHRCGSSAVHTPTCQARACARAALALTLPKRSQRQRRWLLLLLAKGCSKARQPRPLCMEGRAACPPRPPVAACGSPSAVCCGLGALPDAALRVQQADVARLVLLCGGQSRARGFSTPEAECRGAGCDEHRHRKQSKAHYRALAAVGRSSCKRPVLTSRWAGRLGLALGAADRATAPACSQVAAHGRPGQRCRREPAWQASLARCGGSSSSCKAKPRGASGTTTAAYTARRQRLHVHRRAREAACAPGSQGGAEA